MCTVKRISPILFVDEIEPVLLFWDRLGFEKTAEVPHEGRCGFVILEKDGLEVMYQTRASVADDVPAMRRTPMGGTILYMEVDDIEHVLMAMEGEEVVVPRRKTFYGADEIFVREPGGHVVGFAEVSDVVEGVSGPA